MNSRNIVCFAHGKESGPWGLKIRYLAEIAQGLDFDVLSPDFSGVDDPDARVDQLLDEYPDHAGWRVLVGSSMGGYVMAQACDRLQADALLLMAPALYFPPYDREPPPPPALTHVVHGWHDDIVSPDKAKRYASTHNTHLHLVPDDHMLHDQLPFIGTLLAMMLEQVTRETPTRTPPTQ